MFRPRDVGAVMYRSDDQRRQPANKDRTKVNVHSSNSSPPPKPEKHKIHLKGSSERTNSTSSKDKDRVRTRQREVGDSEERRRRERSEKQIDKTILPNIESAMMQELRDKVTHTKGKISKFSEKRGEGGKNVPLPPPPPPPITPAQRQPLAMSHIKQSVIEDEKNSSRTSSSSGRKNRY